MGFTGHAGKDEGPTRAQIMSLCGIYVLKLQHLYTNIATERRVSKPGLE